MTDEVKTEAPTEQPQAAQPQGPDLNLTDLAALKSIIEVATQRGAFKAAELESVGKVFNKLSNFLDSVSKKEA
jgi:hypothetical protein